MNPSPIPEHLLTTLVNEVSGSRAHGYVCEIAKHHRIQASPMYREAAEWIADQLRDFGLDEITIHEYASDGRIHYQTWPTAVGWTVEGAQLWRVGDDGSDTEKIADYDDHKMHLVTLSCSADDTGVLIDAGSGERDEDYAAIDVKGKIVLASGYGGSVHRKAVIERGALGVVVYPTVEDKEGPDTFKYTGMWPVGDERDHITWGFNISRHAADALKSRMAAGEEVRLHAIVRDGVLFDSTLDVLTAIIPGTDPAAKEVMLTAHLCHPYECAEDNGSGCAALMESARAINAAIRSGALPRPARTIRLMWIPEWYGTIAYFDAHPEVGSRTLACLNCDMVGADADMTGSAFVATQVPRTLPAYLDRLIECICEHLAEINPMSAKGKRNPFAFSLAPGGAGSDDFLFSDGAIGVPATMLCRSPNQYHHCNVDTPDLVDPTELKRSTLVTAIGAYWLAAGRSGAADALANKIVEKAPSIIEEAEGHIDEIIALPDGTTGDRARDAILTVKGAAERSMRAIHALAQDYGCDTMRAEAKVADMGIAAIGKLDRRFRDEGIEVPTPPWHKFGGIVAKRTTRGPIHGGYVLERLEGDRAARYQADDGRIAGKRYEVVNCIDGRRSIREIWETMTSYYGPVRIEDIVNYIGDLEAAGLVEVKRE